jgi:hypothetical protein
MKTSQRAGLSGTSVAVAIALLVGSACDSSSAPSDGESDARETDTTDIVEVADVVDAADDAEPDGFDGGTEDAADVAEDSGLDGLDAPDGEVEGGAAEIVGQIDGIHFDAAYVGLGNLWTMMPTGWLRYGQNISIADLPSLCEVMGSGTDPTELYALAFWFYDTEPGTYVVQESADETAIGTPVVEVYLTGRHLDENLHKRHAISGEVILDSISPATNDPLTGESVAEGTFTLTFLKNANATLACMTACDPSGCMSSCDCERPDGSVFTCDTDDAARSCCNDGITETQTVTGWFRATYCFYQCVCLGSDPGCPCFV